LAACYSAKRSWLGKRGSWDIGQSNMSSTRQNRSTLLCMWTHWYFCYWQLILRSYLTAYGILLLAGVIAYGTGSTVYIFGTLRASRSIHGKLIEAILGTTLRCVSRCFYQV